MNEVLQVADRIAVLYLGQMAAIVDRSSVNQTQLVELITAGRSESAANGAPAAATGASA
jgi:D-xylose transport system ATP-binding protein